MFHFIKNYWINMMCVSQSKNVESILIWKWQVDKCPLRVRALRDKISQVEPSRTVGEGYQFLLLSLLLNYDSHNKRHLG